MTSTLGADISTIRANGDRQLRQIARAGKQWKRTIGRTVDMEGSFFRFLFTYTKADMMAAYVYRLCLEYARLWADNRDAWSFTL